MGRGSKCRISWARNCQHIRSALDALDGGETHNSTTINSLPRDSRDKLNDARRDLRNILSLFETHLARGGASQCVLVAGEGGMGKSHLLARVTERRLNDDGVAIMVYGGGMSLPGSPWSSVVRFLDDPLLPNTAAFLGTLNEAAAARGERALICIDAVNEGNARSLWRTGLDRFLDRLKDYTHLLVIISCRTPSLGSTLPTRETAPLIQIDHAGFGGTGGRAAKSYIESRSLTRTLGVVPGPDLDNPLLLKLVCDRLIDLKQTEFPLHVNGGVKVGHCSGGILPSRAA